MKKIATIFALFLLAATSAFADMRVVGMTDGVIANPNNPFDGKIEYVSYYYNSATKEPLVQVDLYNEDDQILSVMFTGTDLPMGMALTGALRKTLVVSFRDDKFTISDMFTYDTKSKLNLKSLHNTLQTRKLN